MLVGCDVLARVAFDWFSTQLPVGAVTAIIGGPAFLCFSRGSRFGSSTSL